MLNSIDSQYYDGVELIGVEPFYVPIRVAEQINQHLTDLFVFSKLHDFDIDITDYSSLIKNYIALTILIKKGNKEINMQLKLQASRILDSVTIFHQCVDIGKLSLIKGVNNQYGFYTIYKYDAIAETLKELKMLIFKNT
jgi:hypothetical protein